MSNLPEISSKISPRLVKIFTAVVVLTIGLFGSLVWYTWDTFRYLDTTQKKYFRLTELSGSIVHLDEVLTMSARMAAATGDPTWEARYRRFGTKLDAAIKEAMVLGQGFSLKDAADKTDTANLKLVDMENQVFDLVRKGQTEKAAAILSSAEYDAQKKNYTVGIAQITETIRGNLKKDITEYHRREYLAIRSILILTPCLVFGWILVAGLIRQYNTNRKQAEEAVWKSEEKFRTIFDKASDGILIADATTKKILQGNATICSMLGYTKEEIESLTINDIHPPKDISHVLDEFEKLAKGETALAEDLPIMRKDGAIFYADIGSSPAIIGGVHCLLGIFRDITERKQAEEALRVRERSYRTLAENLPEIVYRIHIREKSHMQFFNNMLVTVTGYNEEELIQGEVCSIDPLIVEEDRDRIIAEVNAAIKDNRSFSLEYRITHKDGTPRFLIERGRPIFDNDGLNSIDGIIQDVTARKRVEEELRRNQDVTERLAQEIAIIAEIGKVIGSTLDTEEVYERFAAETQKLILFDSLTINLYNFQQNTLCVAYASGLDIDGRRQGDPLVLEGSLSEAVIRARTSLRIQPASIDEIVVQFPRLTPIFQAGLRSIMCVPLLYRDEVIGVLHFRSKKQNAYTDQDLLLAERIGEQVAGAIANAQLYAGLKKTEQELKESEGRYRTLVENASDIVFGLDDTGHITFVNPAALRIMGYEEKEITGRHYPTFIRLDMQEDAMKFFGRQFVKGIPNTYSEYPVIVKNGREIWLGQNTQMVFQDGKVVAFQAVARDITDRRRIEEALKDSEKRYRELSIVDDLTQLYNSRHFYFQLKIELDRSNRYEQPLTLLLLDLDNFKAFNDAYGHVEGDQVLRRLGQVVKRCLRETDFAYRYGGEEFTVLLPMTTSEDGTVTAERIRMEFKKETFSPAPGQDVHVTMSIGLAQYKPQEEMKAFVHRVDQWMYQGKKSGKDRVCSES